MQSFRRHKTAFLSRSAIPGAAVLVIIAILVLLRFAFPGIFFAGLSPLFSFGTSATSMLAALFPSDQRALLAERDALLRENRTLKNENALLLEHPGSPLPEEGGTYARVLARPPLSPYDVLLVVPDTPSAARAGAIVYAEQTPIGIISDEAGTVVRVALFSAPGQETFGWVGEERLPITLLGRGGGAFEARVPREAPLQEGATIFAPGPGALPIGTVVRIEKNPSSPEAILVIRPTVNPFSLDSVVIGIHVLP